MSSPTAGTGADVASNHTTGTGVADGAANDNAIFQCGMCKRQYKRLDHLSRHVRSHTQSRPYRCHVCPKGFARADLLKRHVLGHDAASRSGKEDKSLSATASASPGRVTQACQTCASNHLRCSERKPCHRCRKKGLDCIWDRSMDLLPTPTPTTLRAEGSREPLSSLDTTEADISSGMVQQVEQFDQGNIDPADMMQPLFAGGFGDINFTSGQWTPIGPLDFDMGAAMELDDIDLRFLDAYNTNVPFEFGDSPQNAAPTASLESGVSPHLNQPVAVYTEVFKNSYWRFRPNAQDHGAAEEHNLSLPAATDHQASPESRIPLDRRITCKPLSVAARDRILAMIVQTCRPENLSKAVVSFPSAELLDMLLQYYLSSPVARAESFLHTATFDPNEKRPELLAAMAAYGAVLTSDPALSKLGFAIQECVRIAVPRLWEQKNMLTRDLELGQAFLIYLEIGLWSGRSRKVEIAESFLQPLLTILRRDGRFKRSRYPKAVIREGDIGENLDSAWKKWIEQESFKRLAFRVLQHDTNASMALLVNPLISYAEAQMPFPDPPELWTAIDPQQWKAALFDHSGFNSDQSRSPIDYLNNPEEFHNQYSGADPTYVAFAFLSCAWGLSWEFTQLKAFQKSGPRRWNALLMASRHDELLKMLSGFRLGAEFPLHCAQEISMRLEIIHMHLQTPFDEIQLFAGMEGPEQASLAYPPILEWVRSEAARKAVWHAGQIIKAAKAIPRGFIWGPIAVILYHAALLLWVYGSLCETSVPNNVWAVMGSSMTGGVPEDIEVDNFDGIPVQRFIQLGSGSPCIKDVDEHLVALSQPDKILAAIVRILEHNHENRPRPYLIDNLIQLMGGLQKMTTKMRAVPQSM